MTHEEGERLAIQLFESLVPIFAQYGITPAQVTVVARRVLVQETARVARLQNGRVNQSQIAAATGLSRAEVRKHLTASRRLNVELHDWAPRTAQVVTGWLNDRCFHVKPGHPRPLPFSKGRNSFTDLVRKYGGDIPPRAMAAELSRQGRIIIGVGCVALRKRVVPLRVRAMVEMEGRLDAIEAVLSTLHDSSSTEAPPYARFICIGARDQLELDALRDRAEGIISGAISALNALRASPIVGARGRRRVGSFRMNVALLISEAQFKHNHANKVQSKALSRSLRE